MLTCARLRSGDKLSFILYKSEIKPIEALLLVATHQYVTLITCPIYTKQNVSDCVQSAYDIVLC